MLLRRTTTLTLLLSLIGVTISATSHACILLNSLFITLVDADSLEPIEHGSIELNGWTTSTLNHEGVYPFVGLPDDVYDIEIEAECYLPEDRRETLYCGETESIIVYMDRVTYQVPSSPHTADQNGDGVINLQELLRVVQFHNSDGYHCNPNTEDGYDVDPGLQNCAYHDADYDSTKWIIGLSEILRVVQLFNAGGYHAKSGTEDGFAPNVCTW